MTGRNTCRAWRAGAVLAYVSAAVLHGPAGALGCGFENPNSAAIQRGVLNLAYPEALHVIGALVQARTDGIIAPPPRAADAKDAFALARTTRMLQQFGAALGAGPDDDVAFALVLVEPMLWTRFAVRDGRVATSVHVDGPAAGDLVVITTEATMREIAGHRLTAERAAELGLLRIYGAAAKIERLRAFLSEGERRRD